MSSDILVTRNIYISHASGKMFTLDNIYLFASVYL